MERNQETIRERGVNLSLLKLCKSAHLMRRETRKVSDGVCRHGERQEGEVQARLCNGPGNYTDSNPLCPPQYHKLERSKLYCLSGM